MAYLIFEHLKLEKLKFFHEPYLLTDHCVIAAVGQALRRIALHVCVLEQSITLTDAISNYRPNK